MDSSGIPEGSELTLGAEVLDRTLEVQANATGVIPPHISNSAGEGQPQSLQEHGINLLSPPLLTDEDRKHEIVAGDLHSEGKETGAKRGSSGLGIVRDKLLGSVPRGRTLLRKISPTPPFADLPEEYEEPSSSDIAQDLERLVSLARVPSYVVAPVSESEPSQETAVDRYFNPGRRKVTILSMDGGGMRGLIVARCLAHLESLLQAKSGGDVRLCDYFDFLAGTSTGAIITVMISTPDEDGNPLFTGHGCCQFYAHNGKNIFRPRWYDPFRGTLRQLYRPKYSPKRFEKILQRYLIRNGKVLTMRDTLKPFLVTSFDISKATPHIFVRQAAMKDESKNFSLWEVCRGTASAPTYFEPIDVTSTNGAYTATLIDGGAIQNNPALVAMTHVLGNNEEFPEASGLQDVLILSLGAGQLDEKITLKKARKWGMAGWVRPLLNIMMDGSSDTIDYQLASAFAGHGCSKNYLRIQLSGLPNNTSVMDCSTVKNIHDLINCTDELLEERAVVRNQFGEKITNEETYTERLSWFADQLIVQKRLRDQGLNGNTSQHPLNNPEPGIGPAGRVVSPMFGHLFQHEQLHHNGFSRPLETAKSFRL